MHLKMMPVPGVITTVGMTVIIMDLQATLISEKMLIHLHPLILMALMLRLETAIE